VFLELQTNLFFLFCVIVTDTVEFIAFLVMLP